MNHPKLAALIAEFNQTYDAEAKDRVWASQSNQLREFWNQRVLGSDERPIGDEECDPIIRILDRNGKGNTASSEAVAKAMVPQGAWRRLFSEFHSNRRLAALMTSVFQEDEPAKKAVLIDKLYEANAGKRNRLTGPSGNTVNAFLAAWNPIRNMSAISLKHRHQLIEFLGLQHSPADGGSIGKTMVTTNEILRDGLESLGVKGSARTKSRFCYLPAMAELWQNEHTVKGAEKEVSVTIPSADDTEECEDTSIDEVRQSIQIQAAIARIGEAFGFKIWLPRADRSRVLSVWSPRAGSLLEDLPLGYVSSVIKTIEQIDVLWVRERSIARAFEVEHTTAIYSGLLRMADLVALLPDINVKMHIVAPAEKCERVMAQIRRPVFSLLEGKRSLSEMCTYLSYDSIEELGRERLLAHLSDSALEEFEETAD